MNIVELKNQTISCPLTQSQRVKLNKNSDLIISGIPINFNLRKTSLLDPCQLLNTQDHLGIDSTLKLYQVAFLKLNTQLGIKTDKSSKIQMVL